MDLFSSLKTHLRISCRYNETVYVVQNKYKRERGVQSFVRSTYRAKSVRVENIRHGGFPSDPSPQYLSLIHISEPTRLLSISYAVFCLKKKK